MPLRLAIANAVIDFKFIPEAQVQQQEDLLFNATAVFFNQDFPFPFLEGEADQ